MTGRILIVGAGANQVGIIAKAWALGLFTVAMDASPDAPGLAAADASDVSDICDPDAIARLAQTHAVDAIYPAAEWGVTAAAQAAARLGLPGPGADAGLCARNKLAMRQALEAAGLPNPRFRGVRTRTEAESAARDIGLPVIVKPADGNASRGVTRVDYIEDVSLAFEKARNQARAGTVLVEEFLDGDEFNVDGLVFNGRYSLGGITGKERSDPPHRFDWGIFMPPLLDAAGLARIESTVAAALDAIGFTCGATHVEVILSPQGPRIVEIAGRPGGGRIPTDLIPLTYGTDYLADTLRVALGQPPQERPKYERGSALYWVPSRSGIVTDIVGIEDARALPRVEDLVMSVKIGDRLAHIVDCVTRDRIGYVLTSGASAQDAIATAKRAREACRVVTRPTIEADT